MSDNDEKSGPPSSGPPANGIPNPPVSVEEASKAQALREEQREGRRDLIRALTLCLLAVILVRSFVFEPFKIPSSSMVPTLKIGDRIFVSKFNYGLSLPFSKIELVRWGAPQRGDVIVFLNPRDESLHYIKRVIGVPGDTVEIKGKELWVNGKAFPKEAIEEPTVIAAVGGPDFDGQLFKEQNGGKNYFVRQVDASGYTFSKADPTYTVPENNFFVLGDNRDDSYDSRAWGFVPRENIKGKAQMIWLSLNDQASWGTLDKVRWARCFTPIY